MCIIRFSIFEIYKLEGSMNSSSNKEQAFPFIIQMVKPFSIPLLIMILTNIIWAIDLSLRPYLMKLILNYIVELNHKNLFEVILWPILAYLMVLFIYESASRLQWYFVEIKMIPTLRQNLFKLLYNTLLDHSYNFFENNYSGSITKKISDLTNDIPNITQIIIERLFSHTLALAIATYTLLQVKIEFALIMISWVLAFSIGIFLTLKKCINLADAWSEYGSSVTGLMIDSLSNILSVRIFSGKDYEKKYVSDSLNRLKKSEQKLAWIYFWFWTSYGYSFFIVQGLNFFFLLKGYQLGAVSVGDFALVLSINTAIATFLWTIIRDFSELSKLLGRITQALRIITSPPQIKDDPSAKKLNVKNGEIEFRRVSFSYNEETPLFINESFTIEAGKKTGLVGHSGSGKTTFVKLLLRLYDIDSGAILIDGQNIKNVTQRSLQQNITIIPQDISLFHRSLIDNIRYSDPFASKELVEKAATLAQAHCFISKLPNGYDSFVGEQGIKLSGGQRQRIAMARAILKNAPIFILDEATSHLDSETEKDIHEFLWPFMKDKTTIVIAHRLSTLLHMDRILVFDKGKIVQDGTHSELIKQDGIYRILWRSQIKEHATSRPDLAAS